MPGRKCGTNWISTSSRERNGGRDCASAPQAHGTLTAGSYALLSAEELRVKGCALAWVFALGSNKRDIFQRYRGKPPRSEAGPGGVFAGQRPSGLARS